MTQEAIAQESAVDPQAEWDAISKERETGVPAAEPVVAKPQDKPFEAPAAVDPMKAMLDKIEKLELRTRNAEGHIGGLNHNQKLLQDTLQAASKAATQQVSNAPTQAQVAQAIQDPAEWAELKRQHPEWASATEKGMDARIEAKLAQQKIDPAELARLIQERVAGESAEMRKEVINTTLDAVYPDWQDDVKSEGFTKWLQGQTPEVQGLAASNSIRDATKMLGLWEKSKAANPSANIIADRNKKLANAVGLQKGIRTPPTKSVNDMTPAELWDHEARQRDKARAQR